MNNLNSQTVLGSFSSYSTPSNSGGAFKVEVPQPTVTVAKPVSYEFRVAEYTENNIVKKVALQYRVYEHDNYGAAFLKQDWVEVPRVKVEL